MHQGLGVSILGQPMRRNKCEPKGFKYVNKISLD
jgi:hypothetical protein